MCIFILLLQEHIIDHQWLKTIPIFFSSNLMTQHPGQNAWPLYYGSYSQTQTGCWQGSYGELSEAAAATWTQMESKIQLLGTEKLFHFLGSSRTESFIFHRPLSILAHPSVSWRQQLHVALHTWNLRFPPSPHLSGSSSLLLRSSILKSPMITLHPSQNLAYSISKPIN